MAVATVTTLKASFQETLAFVSYHLRTGVDHMYLFFDDPADEAIPVLEENDRVTCVRCDEAHIRRLGVAIDAPLQDKQNANATYAFEQARQAGADWLVYLDSDELLYTKKPLGDFFARIPRGTDVVLFPVMEAVPQRLKYQRPFEEISLFKYYPEVAPRKESFTMETWDRVRYKIQSWAWRGRKRMATGLGLNHSQIIGHFLLGHSVGKSAVCTSARIKRLNSHLPTPEGGRKLRLHVPSDGALLHFDCRGYERWRVKWKGRVNGDEHWNTSVFSARRKKQMRLFHAAYERDDALVELYKQWYFMPDHEKMILKGLGLVKQIDLDPLLFRYEGHAVNAT